MAKSKITVNAKGWQECGSAGTLIPCWWEDRLLPCSGKLQCLLEINICLPDDLIILKRNECLCSPGNTHKNVSINLIHKGSKGENTQMSLQENGRVRLDTVMQQNATKRRDKVSHYMPRGDSHNYNTEQGDRL